VSEDKFPLTATAEDKIKFPLVTKVDRALNAKQQPVSLVKTTYPTTWTADQIPVTIKAAVQDAQKKKNGTAWTPDGTDPKKGEFESVARDGKIVGSWELQKDDKLHVVHAYPVK
jgi:hypothetical protein